MPRTSKDLRLSERVLRIEEEPFHIALDLPLGVLRLTGGEPDFPTAPFVVEAANRAASEGQTHYTPSEGLLALREGISRKLKAENSVSYDPREIIVTPGSSAAVTLLLLALIDPGDEILLPDPAWFHYSTLIELVGGVPKRIGLDPRDGFQLHASNIEKIATAKTKAIILNNPSNPVGRVLSRKELEEAAAAAERLNITVVSDEIYEKIVYPPNIHASICSLPGMKERSILINGFSKGYAMMGWRLGYLAAPKELARKMGALLGYSLVCPNSVAQHAGIEALANPRSTEYKDMMLKAWDRRRKVVMEYVSASSTLSAKNPEGTFYGWVNVSKSGLDGAGAAKWVLKEENVGVMPGNLFGQNGKDYVRISFATSDDVVDQGMKKLCRSLDQYKKNH